MMRDQALKHKQSFTHKNINTNTHSHELSKDSPQLYNDHKSICYIQLTDYSMNSQREENTSFRTTFFSKFGKRVSPKKNFFKTIIGKFEPSTSQQKIKVRKSETKTSSIARQYSQRSSFIMKKLNETSKASYTQNGNFLFTAQTDNNTKIEDNHMSLLQDIERLRYSENGYLQLLKDKSLLSNTNIVNLEIDGEENIKNVTNPFDLDQIIVGQMREDKEEAALRLRQKIKNKQSRKHIYHSLKTKCEAWNKIRLKTQQHFSNRQGAQLSSIEGNSSTRLHCKPISRNPKNIQAIIIKPKQKPLFDSSNPLKVISKPCRISLNAFTNSSLIQSPKKQMNISLSGNPEAAQLNLSKLKSKRQIYQEIITSIARNKKDGTVGRCRTGQRSQQKNQFRLLTPWKADNEEPF